MILMVLYGVLAASSVDGGTNAGIALRFDWPVGLTAQVEDSYKMFQDSKDWTPRLHYELEVQGADGGEGLRRWVPSHREALSSSGGRISVMTVVFDMDGGFRGYEVPEDDPRRRFVTSMISLVGGRQEQALAEIRSSEELDARSLWDRIVSPWAGRTLAPGLTAQWKTRLRVGPAGGYKDMVSTSTLSIETGVPCQPKAKTTTCVRLISVTKPDDVYVLPDPPDMEDRRWVTERCEVIADPSTLIPYSMFLRRDEKMAYQQADGGTERQPHIIEGFDRSQITFTYPVAKKTRAKTR